MILECLYSHRIKVLFFIIQIIKLKIIIFIFPPAINRTLLSRKQFKAESKAIGLVDFESLMIDILFRKTSKRCGSFKRLDGLANQTRFDAINLPNDDTCKNIRNIVYTRNQDFSSFNYFSF